MSERARRVGQVAWDAVHNHGEHRRQAPNDDYLVSVGVAVLEAIENERAEPQRVAGLRRSAITNRYIPRREENEGERA